MTTSCIAEPWSRLLLNIWWRSRGRDYYTQHGSGAVVETAQHGSVAVVEPTAQHGSGAVVETAQHGSGAVVETRLLNMVAELWSSPQFGQLARPTRAKKE